MQHLQPNTTLQGGKYRIERVLGQGGFGNTYVSINATFEDKVAIKEFFMQGVNDRDETTGFITISNERNKQQFQEQLEKFKKEALRIRQLDNPHIVKVHDLFEENGTAYYVMDYVDGENLAERLKRTGKPMSEQEVYTILPQILNALKSVHDAGIWHLDLKPANIMLDKVGKVKLIDFGASKQLNVQKGGATTSTAISYTNGYAPREQMEQNYDKFGPWTDIYALGATLYNLLTNKRPPLPTDIDDDTSEDKHKTLPMPENTSEEMKSLILWMLHTNKNQRPQDVYSVYFELKQYKPSTIDEEIDESTIIDKSKGKKVMICRCNTRFKNNQFNFFATLIAIIVCICFGAFYYWNYIKAGNNEEYIKPKYQIISDKEKTCELFGSFPEPKENDFLSWYEAYHIQNHACIPRNQKGHYEIPQKVDGYNIVKLGDYSFCNTLLSSIKIPEGVKDVGQRAFAINDNLSRVSFSNGVESIGWRCFENDSLL
jgi:serine/threonine-protein kinase